MLREVCRNASVEPVLQPLSGEAFQIQSTSTDAGAKLDVAADNFWETGQRVFFDVRVFNPCVPT